MIRTFFWSILTVIFASLVQSVILSNVFFLPAIPDLVMLIVIYVSFLNNSIIGSSVGFISGLLLDFISAAPIGLNALTKSITGYITGKFVGKFNINAIIIPCVMAFGGTLFKFLIIFFVSFFIKHTYIYNFINIKIIFYELLVNIIFAPFLFGILNIFIEAFRKNTF